MKCLALLLALSLPSIVVAQTSRWQRIPLDSFYKAEKVIAVDSEVVYVIGITTPLGQSHVVIFRTSNGGTTWHEIDPPDLPDGQPANPLPASGIQNGSYFSAPTRGALFIGGARMCSFDSGVTWSFRSESVGNVAVNWQMLSASTGYGMGLQQRLMKTDDSVTTWSEIRHYVQYDYWTDSLHGIAGLSDTEDGFGIYNYVQGFYGWITTDGGKIGPFTSTI